ncbi:hypothetical protein CA207_14290 [Macrococcoides caseolyticum]|uniref:hypothetical protein n=1 Tax=Macrococcoides caseolyticum TaxID=69966 RepID=UPI000A295255|nr:hypothetical protein [Macrococcus caseolyticus]ARQ04675.1 hypothetical protein CA207_14290 [Macrococcus caseolyticus]
MWNNIKINKSQIAYETDKATLIKLPNSSSYKGKAIWHPSKLVRECYEGKGHWFEFSFTDEWEFKIISQSKHSDYKKIASAETMLEIFEKQIDDEYDNESYLEVVEPEKITDNVEVDESLKR